MRRRFLAAALLWGAAAFAWPASRVRIAALGDSTTAGAPHFLSPLEAPPDGKGDPESQYAYWMMRRHPDWEVINDGISGQRSDQIALRLEDALKAGPQMVIILAGVNDIVQGVPLRETEERLLWMYRRAKAMTVVPVAATVLPYDQATPEQAQEIRRLNAWIRKTSDKERIPLADLNRALADPQHPDRLIGSDDGIHPDVGGYRTMGEALADTVQPLTDIGRH